MVYKDNWRTPNFAVYPTISWRFDLPDSVDVQRALFGALFLLTEPSNWTKIGTAEPETMAEVMIAIVNTIEEVFTVNFIGMIFPYASENPPAGCLPCDNSTYNDDDYPQLASVLNPIFSNGDGTFNTPDLSGRMPFGLEVDSEDEVGDVGGARTHTLTIAQIPSHTHGYLRASPPTINKVTTGSEGVIQFRSDQETEATGGDGAHNNMPPYLVLKYAIVAVAT